MLPGGGGGARVIPPDEYKEFLSLGHGGVFDLDLDNVDVAPWRLPGADIGAYFNFGLNEHQWREYASEVRHSGSSHHAGEHPDARRGPGRGAGGAYPHGAPEGGAMARGYGYRMEERGGGGGG